MSRTTLNVDAAAAHMNWLRLGDSAGFLGAAVREYRAELHDYISSIRSAANEALLPPDAYIPLEVEGEYDAAEGCLRIVREATADDFARIRGVEIKPEFGAVFHTALSLKREQLARKLSEICSLPLVPVEAQRPLQDRITRIDKEMAIAWSIFPTATCLDLVRTRLALRQGGVAWQSLIRWLAALERAGPRVWCLCDTNFFLESRHLFSQVDWHTVWNLPRVVLVREQAQPVRFNDHLVEEALGDLMLKQTLAVLRERGRVELGSIRLMSRNQRNSRW